MRAEEMVVVANCELMRTSSTLFLLSLLKNSGKMIAIALLH